MIKYYCGILLAFLAVVYGEENRNSTFACGQKEKSYSYLDVATEMILKAKENYPNCQEIGGNSSRFMDCAELFRAGYKRSGVYTIWPRSRVTEDKSLEVYCDMATDGGGWVVIQRRGNFLRPNDYFYKDWQSYKNGFGDIERDFWLGNDNIFALTNQRLYSVRFDLTDVEGSKRYALYDTFWIDDENHKYTLHIADYSGDADSGPGNQLTKSNAESSTVATKTPLSKKYPVGFFDNFFHSNKSNVNSSTSAGQKQLLDVSDITGSNSTTGHVPSNYSIVNGTNPQNASSQSNANTGNTSYLSTEFDVIKSWSASDTAVHSRRWLVLTKVTEINKVEEIREDPENNNQKRVINETRFEQLKIVRDNEVYEDDVYNDLENVPELSFE